MLATMFKNITCCLNFRLIQMITQTGVLHVPHIAKALMLRTRGKVKVEIFLTQMHIISARFITDRYYMWKWREASSLPRSSRVRLESGKAAIKFQLRRKSALWLHKHRSCGVCVLKWNIHQSFQMILKLQVQNWQGILIFLHIVPEQINVYLLHNLSTYFMLHQNEFKIDATYFTVPSCKGDR